MLENTSYLLHQITKFGALTVPQMQKLCAGRCSKSTLYRDLKILYQRGYVCRVSHPTKMAFAYTATEEGLGLAYTVVEKNYQRFRARDLRHTSYCAEALISLAHYAKVESIVTERELDLDSLRSFCTSRRPDAIAQIKGDRFSFEVAVEVESASKDVTRIENIFSSYEKTFSSGSYCSAAIFVIPVLSNFERYKKIFENISEKAQSKILLLNDLSLPQLNETIFGRRETTVRNTLEKVRTEFNGVITHNPIKSDTSFLNPPASTPVYKDSGSNGELGNES